MQNDVPVNLYLVLGCFGRIDDGFVSCQGCENKILLIGPHIEKYNELMDFLDTCRLFDRPAFDFNAIRHIMHNMSENFDQIAAGKRLWNQRQLDLYQKFLIGHKMCGTYLKLVNVPVEDKQIISIEEKSIPIEPLSKKLSKAEVPKFNLKLIRGRGR